MKLVNMASSSMRCRVGVGRQTPKRSAAGTKQMLHNCYPAFGFPLAARRFSTYFCVAHSLQRQGPVLYMRQRS
jgi:hypothetical protein